MLFCHGVITISSKTLQDQCGIDAETTSDSGVLSPEETRGFAPLKQEMGADGEQKELVAERCDIEPGQESGSQKRAGKPGRVIVASNLCQTLEKLDCHQAVSNLAVHLRLPQLHPRQCFH